MPARHVPAVLSFEDNHEEADSEMMRRGVTVRSVVAREWLEHPATAGVLASCVAQGRHISVTDRLPITDAADASPAQGTGVRVDGTEAKPDVNKEPDGSYTLVDSTRAMYPQTDRPR
ncbi:hypothetical protein OH786_30720 [Streptomyces atratus]|uniref:Uncharacterized protein n=1 Tax=Streptomyces atratus TaxID=1893 RepID=A0A1K1YX59_STRAR|nr:hypothetical protein [Streptomyces atratus]SFX66399.1 hypothetical protein SAMN02787144_100536 [Streptomyces atratus]